MDPRLLDDIDGANSIAELRKSVESNTSHLGFRYFIYHGRFPHTEIGAGDVYFDNCPDGWVACYRSGAAVDGHGFLGLCGPHDVTPTLWQNLASRDPAMFEAARKFGLVTGSTHPVHGADGERSALSFIKDHGGAEAEREVEGALAHCYLVASYVHAAAARIVSRARDDVARTSQRRRRSDNLNKREREVLGWAAAGKSAAGIAELLSISPRTVLFHLANVRHKLGVANTRHAIGKALSLGLIDVQPADLDSATRRGEQSVRRS